MPQTTVHNTGKVRDVYTTQDSLILVSTDRQSAFDRNLASIPFKGQVLNLTSQWCVRAGVGCWVVGGGLSYHCEYAS